MSGELDTSKLLANMEPVLHHEELVFCSVPEPAPAGLLVAAIAVVREHEGTTLILRRADAEAAGLGFTFPCRRITLTVHSSLEAVGFMAAVATLLSRHRISVNPVAGYYHDHLFVPTGRAEEAITLLQSAGKSE